MATRLRTAVSDARLSRDRWQAGGPRPIARLKVGQEEGDLPLSGAPRWRPNQAQLCITFEKISLDYVRPWNISGPLDNLIVGSNAYSRLHRFSSRQATASTLSERAIAGVNFRLSIFKSRPRYRSIYQKLDKFLQSFENVSTRV